MAQLHSSLVVALVCLPLLFPARAVAEKPVEAKAPGGDRVASATKTALEVRDLKSKKLVWQAKLTNIETAVYVIDSSGRRWSRGQNVPVSRNATVILALSYAPDGKLLALADNAGAIMFNADDGKVVYLLNTLLGVKKLTFSADGKTLTAKARGGEQVFDVASGKRLK